MRILLAAKHAPEGSRPIGGVQTWCRTVKAELIRRGHEAVTWGPEQPVPLGGFDFGIIANGQDTRRAFDLCSVWMIVSHGIIPAERPRGPESGLLKSKDRENIAYTSEEIRDHWGKEGRIIRQPVDLDFWKPDPNAKPIYLTRFSYRAGLHWIKGMARPMGMKYIHLRNAAPERVREILQQSAVVLATGRAALEAMACGVPTVLVDHRSSYQGPLLHTNTMQAMLQNYSGRGGVVPTPENLKEAIEKAREAGSQRSHVHTHHDVRRIVEELLEGL